MINPIKKRYFDGDCIPARDFNDGSLKFFGEVVYEDWHKDKATAQEGLFDQELYWQKVLKPNIEYVIPNNQDQAKIEAIQAELKLYE